MRRLVRHKRVVHWCWGIVVILLLSGLVGGIMLWQHSRQSGGTTGSPKTDTTKTDTTKTDTTKTDTTKTDTTKTDTLKTDTTKTDTTKTDTTKTDTTKTDTSKTDTSKPEPPNPEPPQTEVGVMLYTRPQGTNGVSGCEQWKNLIANTGVSSRQLHENVYAWPLGEIVKMRQQGVVGGASALPPWEGCWVFYYEAQADEERELFLAVQRGRSVLPNNDKVRVSLNVEMAVNDAGVLKKEIYVQSLLQNTSYFVASKVKMHKGLNKVMVSAGFLPYTYGMDYAALTMYIGFWNQQNQSFDQIPKNQMRILSRPGTGESKKNTEIAPTLVPKEAPGKAGEDGTNNTQVGTLPEDVQSGGGNKEAIATGKTKVKSGCFLEVYPCLQKKQDVLHTSMSELMDAHPKIKREKFVLPGNNQSALAFVIDKGKNFDIGSLKATEATKQFYKENCYIVWKGSYQPEASGIYTFTLAFDKADYPKDANVVALEINGKEYLRADSAGDNGQLSSSILLALAKQDYEFRIVMLKKGPQNFTLQYSNRGTPTKTNVVSPISLKHKE